MTTSDRARRPAPLRYPALVRAWRWQIGGSSEPLPLTWALPMSDALFDALGETGWTIRGSRRLPLCLHGPEDPNERQWGHAHAFLLPEDGDDDGLIDHVTVSAAAGLDPAALRLLVATDRLFLSNGAIVELVPQRMGGFECAGHAGPARIWVSRTPYVPPNGRPGFDPKDAAKQLRNEIGKRQLPPLAAPPVHLAELESQTFAPEQFHLERDGTEGHPRGAAPCYFRLEFAEAAEGPLAFGWACHRGLGQFAPVQTRARRRNSEPEQRAAID